MENGVVSSANTLDLLRKQIRDDVIEFVDEQGEVLVLQPPPGVGKTTGTVNALDGDNISFAWFGPDHNSLEENVSKPLDLMHLYGKNRICQHPEKERLSELGVLESKYVCNTCEYNGYCEYKLMQQDFFSAPQSFAAVHQHIPHISGYVEKNYFEVMVIDENFLDSMFLGGTLTSKRIYDNLNMVYKMPYTDERDYMIRYLKGLNELLLRGEVEIEDHRRYELEAFKGEYEEFMIERLFNRQSTYYNDVGWIIDFITTNNDKIVRRRTKKTSYRTIHFADLYQYDFSSLNIRTPTIILDATTPVEIYKQIYNRMDKEVKYNKPDVIANSTAYQLTTHSYPMKFLKLPNIQERLFNICGAVCQVHQDKQIFLCIRKAFKQDLEDALQGYGNTIIAHYGGIRGANTYMEADVAVLIGAPFPNPDVVTMKSQAMKVKKDDILRMDTNEEMNQTLHRIRPLLKEGTFVYILSNVDTGFHAKDYKKIPITEMEKMLNEGNT